MLYLIISYLILFAWLAWKKIDWALLLIIAFLPGYLIRFSVFNLPLTLLESMIIIVFVFWLIKFLNKNSFKRLWLEIKKIFFNYNRWILLFLLVSALGIIISPNTREALGIWKAYFIEPAVFALVFIQVFQKDKLKKTWGKVSGALAFSGVLVAGPAIVQKFTGWGITNPFWADEATRRVVSWYGFPNAIGLFLGPIIVWLSGYLVFQVFEFFKENKNKNKNKKSLLMILVLALIIPLLVLAVIFAKSEGALIGILAGVWFFLIFYPNKKLRLSVVIFTIVALCVFSAWPLSGNYVKNKMLLRDRSGQIRTEQWQETWQMLTNSPMNFVFGSGLSGYQEKVEPFHQKGIWLKDYNDPDWLRKVLYNPEYQKKFWQPTEIYQYPHNVILNFWTEIGLLGLITVFALLVIFIKNYFSLKNRENKIKYLILVAVVGQILVHGLVDVPYFKNDLSVFCWLVLAMSILVLKKEDRFIPKIKSKLN